MEVDDQFMEGILSGTLRPRSCMELAQPAKEKDKKRSENGAENVDNQEVVNENTQIHTSIDQVKLELVTNWTNKVQDMGSKNIPGGKAQFPITSEAMMDNYVLAGMCKYLCETHKNFHADCDKKEISPKFKLPKDYFCIDEVVKEYKMEAHWTRCLKTCRFNDLQREGAFPMKQVSGYNKDHPTYCVHAPWSKLELVSFANEFLDIREHPDEWYPKVERVLKISQWTPDNLDQMFSILLRLDLWRKCLTDLDTVKWAEATVKCERNKDTGSVPEQILALPGNIL